MPFKSNYLNDDVNNKNDSNDNSEFNNSQVPFSASLIGYYNIKKLVIIIKKFWYSN